MLLLIDGYNLLNGSDVFARGRAAGTLAAAREALLAFLAGALEPRLRERTVIVFDAAMAPPGLPRELAWDGISVRIAPRKSTADELIEELIDAAADPRHLLVVSSDHRVQRAARQKGAQFIDSEKWYAALAAQTRAARSSAAAEDKPATADNPFPPGYAADVASEDWRPPRRTGKKS
ncbi:MAG TPA: NYN domain-containing protein [Pirellulaceae bacterium]|nr:NYN domain-containing protein [Pirellulaceae bacterium]